MDRDGRLRSHRELGRTERAATDIDYARHRFGDFDEIERPPYP
jgi:hypothetical protein